MSSLEKVNTNFDSEKESGIYYIRAVEEARHLIKMLGLNLCDFYAVWKLNQPTIHRWSKGTRPLHHTWERFELALNFLRREANKKVI